MYYFYHQILKLHKLVIKLLFLNILKIKIENVPINILN